jgi:hypothetical protein
MATATSRHGQGRRVLAGLGALLALAALAAAISALGGAARHARGPRAGAGAPIPAIGMLPGFAWLRPTPAPSGWHLARLQDGSSALAYPPGWSRIRSDRGSVSAAVSDRAGTIVAYLNATPKQGAETLGDWAGFRARHVSEEGARGLRVLAAARGLKFRTGLGSCVVESYSTTRARYEEVACLVAGAHASTVIVGAAQSSAWSARAPAIERAIASFTT